VTPTVFSRPQLSAGINTADLGRLAEEMTVLHGTDAWAHVDIMDGQFVPALTFGVPLVRAAAAAAPDIRIDAHVMVEEPRRIVPELVEVGAGAVTVHVESSRHPHRTFLELSQARGDRDVIRGVALNPGTPVTVLEPLLELVDYVLVLAVNPGWSGESPAQNTARRLSAIRRMVAEAGLDVLIGVDGGVNFDNAGEIAGWGPDVVVSGRSIFNGPQARQNLRRMQELLTGSRASDSGSPHHDEMPDTAAKGEER
jgi:ribulose-phosphate 3-epimerase